MDEKYLHNFVLILLLSPYPLGQRGDILNIRVEEAV